MEGNTSNNNLTFSQDLRQKAADYVAKEYHNLAKTDPIEFIKKCHKRFCEQKLERFPEMCEVARMQNFIKFKELKETSNKGKFTDTYGWSPDGTFKFQFEIPEELYYFMQNLVYEDFWGQENKKISDRFMNQICKGADPTELLCWVRSHYGANQGKVTSHGL